MNDGQHGIDDVVDKFCTDAHDVSNEASRWIVNLLRRVIRLELVVITTLILGSLLYCAVFAYSVNFEHVIISDGTERVCLYDGTTGQVRPINGR